MAVQTYLDWDPLVLQPVFRAIYQNEMDQKLKKDYIPILYNVEGSQKAVELFDGAGGEGLMIPWKESNNQVAYGEVQELWRAQYEHVKYSLGREIDRDFVDDLKVPQLKNILISMADAVYKTQQYQAVEIYNNGFNTTGVNYLGRPKSFKGPDGQPLYSASHPYSPTNSVDVQSNLMTKELTIDTWDEAQVMAQGWVDDRGVLMAANLDEIMVHPYNMRVAFQIAGIDGKGIGYEPGSSDFNINVFEGQIKVIVNPFLTSQKAWFAFDSGRRRQHAIWFWRRRAENGTIEDFDTEVAKFKVVGRWSYGYNTPWYTIGSTGVDPA
ncbi:phage head protein [Paenibacillus sp. GYB003]|uniref:phage head protein n=1 Tax=Paenibacillus sp. GYB003 TaxID=2994392 RepID=UPI002F96504F